jgi:hypothetical protein
MTGRTALIVTGVTLDFVSVFSEDECYNFFKAEGNEAK